MITTQPVEGHDRYDDLVREPEPLAPKSHPSAYPTTRTELGEAIPEAPVLAQWHTRELREDARRYGGYSDEMTMTLLGIDTETLRDLDAGRIESAYPKVGRTAKLQRLLDDYARLLAVGRTLGQRDVPQADDERVAAVKRNGIGEVDTEQVSRLRGAMQGYYNTLSGKQSNPIQRVQALSEFGMSVASVAAAIKADAEKVFEWLTGIDTPPIHSEQSDAYYRAVGVLLGGFLNSPPPGGWSATSKAFRAGDVY